MYLPRNHRTVVIKLEYQIVSPGSPSSMFHLTLFYESGSRPIKQCICNYPILYAADERSPVASGGKTKHPSVLPDLGYLEDEP